jgi:hypothetical protein
VGLRHIAFDEVALAADAEILTAHEATSPGKGLINVPLIKE